MASLAPLVMIETLYNWVRTFHYLFEHPSAVVLAVIWYLSKFPNKPSVIFNGDSRPRDIFIHACQPPRCLFNVAIWALESGESCHVMVSQWQRRQRWRGGWRWRRRRWRCHKKRRIGDGHMKNEKFNGQCPKMAEREEEEGTRCPKAICGHRCPCPACC